MAYLIFEDRGTSPSGKTRRWTVVSSQDSTILGWVDWKAGWRKYVFNPTNLTTFDADCLIEIANFLKHEMSKR